MAKIEIEIPDEIACYSPDITAFVMGMVHKLWVHRSKGHWSGIDVYDAFDLLLDEARELEDELWSHDIDVDALRKEAFDVANFAMIIVSVVDRNLTNKK